MQPLDAGIIAQAEKQFRRRMLFRVCKTIIANKKSIYNTEILSAMRWISEEWYALPGECIHNCFKHCFEDRFSNNLSRNNQQLLRDQVVRDLNEHCVQ